MNEISFILDNSLPTLSSRKLNVQKAINLYKEKYFLLDHTTNIDEYIYNSYRDLTKIKTFLEETFQDIFPPLLSDTLIKARIRIREQQDQYRKEILAKTQCLRENNSTFIDPNYDIDVLGFNNIPYIQFKFVGLTIGEYKINNIEKTLAFGLLYDYEEFPSKGFVYDKTHKSLEIIPDTFIDDNGEEQIKTTDTEIKIIEDKWINAPGDIDDDDKFDSLLNVGPREFRVKFYYGNITLKVTGNFGIVSYFMYDIENDKKIGYMGGQKRLKFSEICVLNSNG